MNFSKNYSTEIEEIDVLEAGVDECNRIYFWLTNNYRRTKFKYTKSGAISTSPLNNKYGYEVIHQERAGITITANTKYGWIRLRFCTRAKDENGRPIISGTQAFRTLLSRLPELRDEIGYDEMENLTYKMKSKDFYNIESGVGFLGVPESAASFNNKELNNLVCSLDVHSAFPAALAKVKPELLYELEQMYQDRKNNPVMKGVLNNSIGFFASELTQYHGMPSMALAKLRHKLLGEHQKLMATLAKEIEKQGGFIINWRIDSLKFIWNKPNKPVLNGEGKGLGEWEYEFFQSPRYIQSSTGHYQYIDNDGYLVHKQNGLSKVEKKLRETKTPRQWEHFFANGNEEIIGWTFSELGGFKETWLESD